MKTDSTNISDYIARLPEDRKAAINRLRQTFSKHLPKGFEETISYGMIGFVVPKSIYPKGYHCKPEEPLPFISIASQKNFIAVYHMGLYADAGLLQWFVEEYPKQCTAKLDMGKSCIRFKKPDAIPYELLGQLATKMTVKDWVTLYETNLKR